MKLTNKGPVEMTNLSLKISHPTFLFTHKIGFNRGEDFDPIFSQEAQHK
jgi:hypothetical protein